MNIEPLVDLVQRYAEPHRHYHTLAHITKMLTVGLSVATLTDAQILAIWYHDVIYAPGSKTNEADSASLFFDHYKGRVNDSTFAEVYAIIGDTQDHIPSLEQSKLVIDLDLMGLADDWEQYIQSTENIRLEYGMFNEEQWKHGRIQWIDSMLNKKQIFYTDWGRRLHMKATLNLQNERRTHTDPYFRRYE